jgi:hypothetical protein
VLDKLHQPAVFEGIEEAADVGIEHPVHLSRHDSDRERVQRLVRVATRSEPIGETEEVRLVDGVQHLDRGSLDDLVLQRWHSERPLPPIRLWYVRPSNRSGPVRSPLQPFREILKVGLQVLAVVPPRLAVHSWGRLPVQFPVGCLQSGYVVDVVEERGEPLLSILLGCLAYPLDRAGRSFPALCPESVALGQVPLGPPPSLHPLRRRSSGFVRRLPRYYEAVRLPASVHHRRAPFGFPVRSEAPSAPDKRRISRFPCVVFPDMHGVFDRAGSGRLSR